MVHTHVLNRGGKGVHSPADCLGAVLGRLTHFGLKLGTLHMRFHLGAIPCSPDFVPDSLWRSLRQPSPWLEKLLWPAIGAVAAATVAATWFLVTPLRNVKLSMSLPASLLSVAGAIVVHELIHVLAHPRAVRSPNSIVGVGGPSTGVYAHYDGEMTRNRFVAILLMPVLVISMIPLLVSAVTQVSFAWVALASTFNAFGACADMLLAGLVLFQIPATAIIRQQGLRTYWREHETPAS